MPCPSWRRSSSSRWPSRSPPRQNASARRRGERERAPTPSGAQVLARLTRGLRDLLLGLLSVLLPALLSGLLGRLGDVARNLLTVLERLLAGLRCAVLDLVGHRADLLVFDPRRRHEHAGHEADRDRSEREADGVLLRDPGGAAGAVRDLVAARRGAADLRLEVVDPAGHGLLRPRLDVRLVGERLHGVAHALAG